MAGTSGIPFYRVFSISSRLAHVKYGCGSTEHGFGCLCIESHPKPRPLEPHPKLSFKCTCATNFVLQSQSVLLHINLIIVLLSPPQSSTPARPYLQLPFRRCWRLRRGAPSESWLTGIPRRRTPKKSPFRWIFSEASWLPRPESCSTNWIAKIWRTSPIWWETSEQFRSTVKLRFNGFEGTSHFYPLLPKSVIANIQN